MGLTGHSKWGSSEVDFVFVLSVLVFAQDLSVGIELGAVLELLPSWLQVEALL